MISLLFLALFPFAFGWKKDTTQDLPLDEEGELLVPTGDYWCQLTTVFAQHGGERIAYLRDITTADECKAECDEQADVGCNVAFFHDNKVECELFANVPALKVMPKNYNHEGQPVRSVYAKMCPMRLITKCMKGRAHYDSTHNYIGKYDSAQECVEYVAANFPETNGATYMKQSRKCWSETGMTEVVWGGTNDRYYICKFLSRDGSIQYDCPEEKPKKQKRTRESSTLTMALTSPEHSNGIVYGLSGFGFAVVLYGAGKHFLGKN